MKISVESLGSTRKTLKTVEEHNYTIYTRKNKGKTIMVMCVYIEGRRRIFNPLDLSDIQLGRVGVWLAQKERRVGVEM